MLASLGLRDPWLVALLCVGLLLRIATALVVDPDMRLRGDERNYLRQAVALRDAGSLETGAFVRPPAYFVLLAGIAWISELLDARFGFCVRLVQGLAGAAAAIPVYRSARRLGGTRVARLAAGFLLLDPTLIAFAHLIWPETFFLLLVASVFDGISGIEKRSAGAVAGLGAGAGLALLMKPVFGIFTLLLAAHWLRRLGWRRALRLTLVFGGTAAVVVAPWVARNQLRYGPTVVLDNQGSYNLWIGNDPAPPGLILKEWKALPDPVTRSRVATERGLAAIAGDPRAFAANSAVRALNLWGLEFFVVRHAVIGGYGDVSRDVLLKTFWGIQAPWVLAFVCAALGLRRTLSDTTLRLLVAYAAVFTVAIAALVTTTRFRVPFALPLAVASAAGLDLAISRRLRRADLVAAAFALGVLAFSFTRPLFWKIASGDFSHVTELALGPWRFFRY